jgi:hypothetical protein
MKNNSKLIAVTSVVASISLATSAIANPAPSLTIFNPSGYGASDNTGYVGVDFQSRTRYTQKSDAELGVGVGVGNAKDVALDINYTVNSLTGSGGGKTGDGGFSAKVHKQLSDDSSVAIGYNQFAKIGTSDYQSGSYYAVGTKVLATQDKLDKPFSRVAITAGVGGGVFNGFDPKFNPDVNKDSISPFASVAVRVAEPVSAIVEWTGQDLAAGLSIKPFRDVPLTLTPAFRDISGAGNGARFVMGAGYSFKF